MVLQWAMVLRRTTKPLKEPYFSRVHVSVCAVAPCFTRTDGFGSSTCSSSALFRYSASFSFTNVFPQEAPEARVPSACFRSASTNNMSEGQFGERGGGRGAAGIIRVENLLVGGDLRLQLVIQNTQQQQQQQQQQAAGRTSKTRKQHQLFILESLFMFRHIKVYLKEDVHSPGNRKWILKKTFTVLETGSGS